MPEVQTHERAGLVTKARVPVPLTGVSLDAEISAFCARVTVAQRYVNRETTPIEAVYLFPLDEGAAVSGFEAVIDGTLVVGEVRRRDEAFAAYDDAMARGDGAFLLDEERPDVFRASVGNLPPGKEVLLKLTYVTELTVHHDGLRFAIPTTVAPRYAPAEDTCGVVGESDAQALGAPRDWDVPYGLTLAIRLAMPGPIARIESPSHPVSVAVNGSSATVSLAAREAALDRDVVLAIEAEGLDTPQAWIERNEAGREAIALAFVPALPSGSIASEVIFVVDRSGSMEGTSIAEVRNALQLCLRSLTPGSRFNIVGFGSTVDAFSPESRVYDDRSLEEASRYVERLEADLGGTEILPALEGVLKAPRTPGLARQLVVLTDGEVTNTDAVIDLGRRHQTEARLFTFGIGAGASHHLVRGLARAGGGAAEFIHPGERIEPKILRQLARLSTPALTDVRLSWGGLRVTQAPTAVPPVFAGSRMLVYGFAEEAVAGPCRARLEGMLGTEPVAFEVPIDPARASRGRVVGTLAARARIRELEEGGTWAPLRGSQQRGRAASAVANEIAALAIEYGLMSRETSYVAIERRETPVHGETQLRRVPIALTAGWGALERARRFASPVPFSPAAGAPAAAVHAASFSMAMPDAGVEGPDERSERRSFLRSVGRILPSRAAGRPRRMREPVSPLQRVISMQRAGGWWPLTPELADAVGAPVAELESALRDARDGHERRIWATAIAIAWLELSAADREDEWRLIAKKARAWLSGQQALDRIARASGLLQSAAAARSGPRGG